MLAGTLACADPAWSGAPGMHMFVSEYQIFSGN